MRKTSLINDGRNGNCDPVCLSLCLSPNYLREENNSDTILKVEINLFSLFRILDLSSIMVAAAQSTPPPSPAWIIISKEIEEGGGIFETQEGEKKEKDIKNNASDKFLS